MTESIITESIIAKTINEERVTQQRHTDHQKIYFLESKNNFNPNHFFINGKLWAYIEVLSTNLDRNKFIGYFNKTFMMYSDFKSNNLKEVPDYFRRCQFLSLLESINLISNSSLNNSIGLIKIGPSKNGKKNCCLIDDSTIIDENDNTIRITNGSELEPHRGFQMFNQLSEDKKKDIIDKFYYSFVFLKNILKRIKSDQYILFDPIEMLQRIVRYCEKNNIISLINLLSSEIHDTPYKLNIEQKINLFHNYDNLFTLWNTNFINENNGKFRIFVLSIHFMNLIYRYQIKEI